MADERNRPKQPRYRFKYLLYPDALSRFTHAEAQILASSADHQAALIRDLTTRAATYRKTVLQQVDRYPEVLAQLKLRLTALRPAQPKKRWHESLRREGLTRPAGIRTSMSGVTSYSWMSIVNGGAPGGGRKS